MFKTDRTEHLRPLPDLLSLKGHRAVITGSASGIGKAIAYRFGEAGAALELVDVNRDTLLTMKEELTQQKISVTIHEIDLAKKTEIDDLWKDLSNRARA
jgi:short-subunit dehydrogenase